MLCSEILLRYLEASGIRRVFGVAGRETRYLRFEQHRLPRFVNTHQEFSAGLIACGLSRFTNQPQVCFGTMGPGATNLVTAVASAALDHYPLLAIAAQVETNDVHYNYTRQCVDAVSVMSSLCRYAVEIQNPSELVPALDRAMSDMMREPHAPAFLSIPVDLFECDIAGSIFTPPGWSTSSTSPPIDAGSLRNTAEVLAGLRRPMIIAGEAIARQGAAAELRAFAAHTGIPVVTSHLAKGVISPNDPLNFGTVTRNLDELVEFPALDELFEATDGLLLVGLDPVDDVPQSTWKRGIHKEVFEVASMPASVSSNWEPRSRVLGGFRQTLPALSDLLGRHWHAQDIRGQRDRMAAIARRGITANSRGAVDPRDVVCALNRVFSEHILVSDIGLHRQVAAVFHRACQPLDFLTSGGLSSIGSGLPLGIAAKLANPGRDVVVIAGDVGFHSTAADLELAARMDLDLKIVVLNDQRSALMERYARIGAGRDATLTGTSYGRIDFAMLSEANGCTGYRAETIPQLLRALENERGSHRPMVVDVSIEYPGLYLGSDAQSEHRRIATEQARPAGW